MLDKYLHGSGLSFIESIAAEYPARAYEGYAQLVDVVHSEHPLNALIAVSAECAERIRALSASFGDCPNEVARAYAARILDLVKAHVRQDTH
jgi:hypothetical protein